MGLWQSLEYVGLEHLTLVSTMPTLHNRQKYFTICQLHDIFNNYSFKEHFSMSNRHSWIDTSLH